MQVALWLLPWTIVPASVAQLVTQSLEISFTDQAIFAINLTQMSQLYTFGLNTHTTPSPSVANKPTLFAEGQNINILWASWCDLIYVSSTDNDAHIHYSGSSLTPEQAEHIHSLTPNPTLKFFGTDLSHGVLGYISPPTHSITFFATPSSLQEGHLAIRTHSFSKAEWDIHSLRVTSANRVLMSILMRRFPDLPSGYFVENASLEEFEKHMSRSAEFTTEGNYSVRLGFAPSQWCANVGAVTALDEEGKIYTLSLDHRYPRCLGRDDDGSNKHAQIPYFSETKISKIAAGGYYAAAITADGELYMWGQGNPAPAEAKRELSVLKDAGEDEDEFVRSVELEMDGRPVRAIDVSVGWGHILVVGEGEDAGGRRVSSVFAAGHNEHGQLGVDGGFVENFVELPEFRGWDVEQLVCAGFTSYVVKRSKGL